jgi:hypothetical protein
METKFDIDDVLYVPATVSKVIKTSDGKVSYGLDICGRDEVEVTLTEDEVKKLCLLDSVMTTERYAKVKKISDHFGVPFNDLVGNVIDHYIDKVLRSTTWVFIDEEG